MQVENKDGLINFVANWHSRAAPNFVNNSFDMNIANQADFIAYYENIPSRDPAGDGKRLYSIISIGKGGVEHDTKESKIQLVYSKRGGVRCSYFSYA